MKPSSLSRTSLIPPFTSASPLPSSEPRFPHLSHGSSLLPCRVGKTGPWDAVKRSELCLVHCEHLGSVSHTDDNDGTNDHMRRRRCGERERSKHGNQSDIIVCQYCSNTWMDQETLILSGGSQTKTNMILLTCGILKKDTNELIYKTERVSPT